MALNIDLMKAILAMDAYNRNYNEGIELSGTGVGNANIAQIEINGENVALDSAILRDDNDDRLDQQIGFYAISYEYNDKLIISYRGTDEDFSLTGDDMTNGWLLGYGNYNVLQATMAIEFYKAAAENKFGEDYNLQTDPIQLTGHSMGGGFAGYAGLLYGQDAVVFDSMAFETAAESAHFYASFYDI